jgi:hypothetical protein
MVAYVPLVLLVTLTLSVSVPVVAHVIYPVRHMPWFVEAEMLQKRREPQYDDYPDFKLDEIVQPFAELKCANYAKTRLKVLRYVDTYSVIIATCCVLGLVLRRLVTAKPSVPLCGVAFNGGSIPTHPSPPLSSLPSLQTTAARSTYRGRKENDYPSIKNNIQLENHGELHSVSAVYYEGGSVHPMHPSIPHMYDGAYRYRTDARSQ